ncbi:hypothetical protein Rs2_34065 [Raphanus sativus]|nr:hypothetical protein Rs2_34065 [Raphanus sativus]
METALLRFCVSFSGNPHHKKIAAAHHRASCEIPGGSSEDEWSAKVLSRRSVLATVSGLSLVSSTSLAFPGEGLAVVKQGLLAGRVPGLSEPDDEGWRTYRRPDEKSGGHGVGWSPIIPYAFSVPQDWNEVPVSIADLGGTEIDLRFASPKEGRLSVIVAPVLRFADNLGDNVKIENIGTPAKFELEPPHVLITATAAGNRLYLFSVTGNGLQWKRYYKDLKKIATSFRVV